MFSAAVELRTSLENRPADPNREATSARPPPRRPHAGSPRGFTPHDRSNFVRSPPAREKSGRAANHAAHWGVGMVPGEVPTAPKMTGRGANPGARLAVEY